MTENAGSFMEAVRFWNNKDCKLMNRAMIVALILINLCCLGLGVWLLFWGYGWGLICFFPAALEFWKEARRK